MSYIPLTLGERISGLLLLLRWVCHLGKAGDQWSGAGHVIDLTLGVTVFPLVTSEKHIVLSKYQLMLLSRDMGPTHYFSDVSYCLVSLSCLSCADFIYFFYSFFKN